MQSLHVENHGKTKTVIGVLGLLKKKDLRVSRQTGLLLLL